MIKKPFTKPNVITYMNVESGFVLFGDDIIVPIVESTDGDEDVYVIGPCLHLGGAEFTLKASGDGRPTIH